MFLRRQPCQNASAPGRSEEHTSELQSHVNLVCRLLLEKKKAVILGGGGQLGELVVGCERLNRDKLVLGRGRFLAHPVLQLGYLDAGRPRAVDGRTVRGL